MEQASEEGPLEAERRHLTLAVLFSANESDRLILALVSVRERP
jgi:hypothetical protein